MDLRQFSNKLEDFHQFLNEISQEFKSKSDVEDPIPVRLSNPRITLQELEGECLEWCRDFLATRRCPVGFDGLLCHQVYEQISKENLEDYIIEKDGQNDESEEDQRAEVDERVYCAEKLQDHVLNVLEDVCQKWATNCPELRVDGKLPVLSYYAIKNTRRKMEDKHIISPDLNALFGLKDKPPQSFYAVFDGHAGTEAATFASKHLHCNLVHKCDLDKNPPEACKAAFKMTDEQFISKAKQEKWKSGSTGVTALVRGNQLFLTWLGDSQAALVKDGQVVTRMEPHKPDRQEERDRIEALGGFVMRMGDLWRVGGNLAVSRAIGDAGFKPFVSSDAEVLEIKMDGTEDYMVLACDGFWDAVTTEELPRLVYNILQESNDNKLEVAKRLVQHAKENQSTDNISVIIVFFRDNIAEPTSEEVGLFNFGAGDPSQGLDESGSGHGERESGRDENGGSDFTGGNSNLSAGKQGNSDGQLRQVDQCNILAADAKSIENNLPKLERDIKMDIGVHYLLELDRVRENAQSCDNLNNEVKFNETSDLKPRNLTKSEIIVNHQTMEGEIESENAQFEKVDDSLSSGQSDSQQLQKENTPEDDLDVYGVFNTRLVDGPIDLAMIDDQNSSFLLKDIARSVLNQDTSTRNIYGPLPQFGMNKDIILPYRHLEPDDHGVMSFGTIIEKKSRKRGKKSKAENWNSQPRDPRRKGTGNSPVCWSFTGKNLASVQNHRLNLAAKSQRVSSLTPGELTLANKAPQRVAEKSLNKVASNFSSTENVHEIANMTLTNTKLDSLPPPRLKNKFSSLSKDTGFTVFGNKSGLQSESQKFQTTLRTRKPLKPITTVVYETPPTPFMSNKIPWDKQH